MTIFIISNGFIVKNEFHNIRLTSECGDRRYKIEASDDDCSVRLKLPIFSVSKKSPYI